MLTELIIRNFAIIDQLQLRFGPGFNVLTGETGAGKSILIGALQLLLGGRARTELIRSGEEEASVEALFEDPAADLREALDAAGLPAGDELLVRRVLNRAGKNRIYVNGSLATLAQWEPIGERLVAIFGQHEHQLLLRRENHLQMLDAFAGLQPQRAICRELHQQSQDLRHRLAGLEQDDRQRRQQLELLLFQRDEIQAAKLQAGEEEQLLQERSLLLNAERLRSATAGGYHRLYGEEGSALERLDLSATELERLAGVDAQLDGLAGQLRSLQLQLDDVACQLRDYGGVLEFDPGYQDQVEHRLALIGRLKRKYGSSVEAVLAHLAEVEAELSQLGNADSNRELWATQLTSTQQQLQAAAAKLSTQRAEAAQRLASGVVHELKDLAMAGALFEVRLEPTELGADGGDLAEFYLAANAGEDARPLARIASGGELSRIMLALRRAAPQDRSVGTAVFDEVDAGIGGATATAVGRKLREVARGGQALCITHLPQVACFGDAHFRVEKVEIAGRTVTRVVHLDPVAREGEMARLLGGDQVTERTLAHAREMIQAAHPVCA